jgi:hypothetical protein
VSEAGEIEEVDAVPVLAPEAVVRLPSRALGRSLAPVQVAAVAAGSFVAGAAVVGLAHRRRGRAAGALAREGRRGGRAAIGRGWRKVGKGGELVQIIGTRSLLVDMHLLGGVDRDR